MSVSVDTKSVDLSLLESADVIIDFHSHPPCGTGMLTVDDVLRAVGIMDIINVPYFQVVYFPPKDRTYWYEYKKL